MTGFSLGRRAALTTLGAAATVPLLRPEIAKAEAPMLGPSRAQFHRFTLGGFEVTTLLDGAIQLDGPFPIFGENVAVEEVTGYAEQHFLPSDKMEIGFAPVLVNTGTQLVLFDGGNPASRLPAAGNLVAVMQAAGYTPDQVDIVVLTHFHPDHIGGLMVDGAPTFPNATYATSEIEYDFWSAEDKLSGPTERVATLVQSNVVPLAEKMTFVKDEGEVVPGIRAINANGHTPGHMAYHIESDGHRLLLWADTTNHYVVSLQQPGWHVRFDMDKEGAVQARRRILDMVATDRIPASGYHMPFPAVGFVEKVGDGYRWIPASYQLNL